MRAFKFLNLAILSALVATSAALYAQDEKQQEDKPKQEEAKPAGKQDEVKKPKQEEAKPSKQDKNEQKETEKQRRNEMKTDRQESVPRPAGKSVRIPDEKFRAQFGRGHAFHPQRPVVVQGQPGIVYGGYSFVFVDVWPAEWSYDDDCYVDYVDGEYFLFDVLHPGVRIALFVVE
jgi:hypothetical protein